MAHFPPGLQALTIFVHVAKATGICHGPGYSDIIGKAIYTKWEMMMHAHVYVCVAKHKNTLREKKSQV